ncbi:MAG: hypothetical protein IJ736_04630 [Firmicutes bacterium]|nr:hypothetical protein [Bacillota bacterium]
MDALEIINEDFESEHFKNVIEEIINEKTKECFSGMQVYDTVVVFKDISVGLDNPIYFYNDSDRRYTLDEISGISEILRLDSDYLPLFYIYVLVDDDGIIKRKRDDLLESIGRQIGTKIVERIEYTLNEQIKLMEE